MPLSTAQATLQQDYLITRTTSFPVYLYDFYGKSLYTVAMDNDTQQEIQSLRKELEKCRKENKAKSEFLSMVTHQLRTPLSGIKWTFKMLLDGDLGSFSEEQRQIIEKGSESNKRMINLLQEIILANQTDSWDFQYSKQPSDLQKILSNIIPEFLEEARANDIRIVVNHPDTPLPLVHADPEKIAIVFQNLLENAVKYSNTGDVITIDFDHDSDTVTISIADTGLGIPEKAQESIFEKFFRADNVKEIKKEGTGLGLFTAKNIVEKHNGNIRFESKLGKGTTFFVTLPISTVDNQ